MVTLLINFTSFPNMETKNLLLRRIEQNDVNDLFKMRKDPRMHAYTDTKIDINIIETNAYIDKMNTGVDDRKWLIWVMEHKQSKKVIGSISIWNLNKEEKSGELGYGIIPDYQGQGLMKESLLKVIEYGFDVMNLNKLDAYTEENNESSIKLLEKCKFIEIDKVDEQGYMNNRMYHMKVYRLER